MENIKSLIAKDKTGIAIRSLLTDFLLDEETTNTLRTISARFERLRKKSIQNIIEPTERDISLNRINISLLELLPEIESQISKSEHIEFKNELRYYIYYSETKINMLFSQISNTACTDYEKIYSIENALKAKDLVGCFPDLNKQFIYGRLTMNWGWLVDYASDIVFFGCNEADFRLCLIGSRYSLIGEIKKTDLPHSGDYYLFRLMNRVIEDIVVTDKEILDVKYLEEIDRASYTGEIPFDRFMKNVINRQQSVEFLAKKITVLNNNRKLIIATPIYVSY